MKSKTSSYGHAMKSSQGYHGLDITAGGSMLARCARDAKASFTFPDRINGLKSEPSIKGHLSTNGHHVQLGRKLSSRSSFHGVPNTSLRCVLRRNHSPREGFEAQLERGMHCEPCPCCWRSQTAQVRVVNASSILLVYIEPKVPFGCMAICT